MANPSEAFSRLILTAWVGSMWAVGYLVAPTLFQMLGDRALAGNVAGRLFSYVAWMGLIGGGCLLALRVWRMRLSVLTSLYAWVLVVMLLLTAAGHFGIQPLMAQLKTEALPREVMQSVVRDRFATWHGISSVLYLVQSLLGVVLVWLSGGQRR